MPNKRLIAKRTVTIEDSLSFLLKYYLLSKQSCNELASEAACGKVYGILIEKSGDTANCECEFEAVAEFTYNKNEALEFIELLANELVTPLTLLNIIDDYITFRENTPSSLLAVN